MVKPSPGYDNKLWGDAIKSPHPKHPSYPGPPA